MDRTVEEFRVVTKRGIHVYGVRTSLAECERLIEWDGSPGLRVMRRTVRTVTTDWVPVIPTEAQERP